MLMMMMMMKMHSHHSHWKLILQSIQILMYREKKEKKREREKWLRINGIPKNVANRRRMIAIWSSPQMSRTTQSSIGGGGKSGKNEQYVH